MTRAGCSQTTAPQPARTPAASSPAQPSPASVGRLRCQGQCWTAEGSFPALLRLLQRMVWGVRGSSAPEILPTPLPVPRTAWAPAHDRARGTRWAMPSWAHQPLLWLCEDVNDTFPLRSHRGPVLGQAHHGPSIQQAVTIGVTDCGQREGQRCSQNWGSPVGTRAQPCHTAHQGLLLPPHPRAAGVLCPSTPRLVVFGGMGDPALSLAPRYLCGQRRW